MKQIPPYRLWVGHVGDARDFAALFRAGVQALVDVAMEEPPAQPPRELFYCRFPLLDGAGNNDEPLALAISTVSTLLALKVPTLVTCSMGMSRAPCVTAAALSVVERRPPEECLQRVVQAHPADITAPLWLDVIRVLATRHFPLGPAAEGV